MSLWHCPRFAGVPVFYSCGLCVIDQGVATLIVGFSSACVHVVAVVIEQ